MKNSEMQTQKILNYMYGKMSQQENNLIKNEIETQDALKRELFLQQEIDKAIIKELKIDRFKVSLNQIHESQTEKPAGKILNMQNKWYWAAASLTIFSGSALYSLKNNFQSPDRLFKSYYQVWQPSIIVRGLETEQLAQNVIKDFEKGDFTKVIKVLEQDYKDNMLSPKLILLKGCAEMEIKDYNSAIETFSVFDSKDYTFYTEAGQWYQALCYLKNDEIESSKLMLKTIVDNNTSYASEAKELLEKLK